MSQRGKMAVDSSFSKDQKAVVNDARNPRTPRQAFVFFGPFGAAFIIVFLPLVVYALFFLCHQEFCLSWRDLWQIPRLNVKAPFQLSWDVEMWHRFFSLQALGVILGWFAFQVLLYYLIPGKYVPGTKIRDGSRLYYKINAFPAAILSFALFFFGIHSGWIPKSYVYDNFLRLATASIILSFSISIFVYFKAKISPKALLAVGGNSGNIIYDFFIGHELNPRIGNFDLKYFCELRPGLIGWAILNFGFAAKQYEMNHNLGLGMILVCLYQCVYVLDALYMESSILTTMDITTEGFGFMLAFGDLSWVPFTYSTQARFLATRADPINSNFFLFLVIVFLQVFGYWIFRGSNNEKNTFRTDPNSPFVKHLKFLDTKRGTKLLISGFWGVARHVNYLGDLLMALSWCLCSGYENVIPFFYFIYFTILLVHRDIRDDEHCLEKYGQDWIKYRSIVPYRILPFVY